MRLQSPSSQAYQTIASTIQAAIDTPPPRVSPAAEFAEDLITLNIKRLSFDHCLQLHGQLQQNGALHSIYGKLNMVSIISALQQRAIEAVLSMHPYREGDYQDVTKDHDRFPIEATMHLIEPLLTSMESGYTIHYRALQACIQSNEPPISFMQAMAQDSKDLATFEPSAAYISRFKQG